MFNINLKRIRLEQELSQKQIADFLTVSPQSVSKWEKGEALPSIDFLPKLAECLNCDVNAFFSPVKRNKYDLNLLKDFLSIMYDLLYLNTIKNADLRSFLNTHPDISDTFDSFYKDFTQNKTINVKTIQAFLDCPKGDAEIFLELFIKHEFVEELDASGTYFVLKSNVNGLKILLKQEITMCDLID